MLASTINNTNIKILTDPGLVDQPATVTLAADQLTVTVDPTANLLPSQTYRMRVTTGVRDLASNAKATQEEWTLRTDDILPTITSRTPASGASAISLSTNITIVFSENMQAGTITTGTIGLKKTVAGTILAAPVTLGADLKTVTMDPTATLEDGTQYTVTVIGGASGVKDIAGNALVATSTWTFTTVAPTYTLIYNYSGTSWDELTTNKKGAGLRLTDTDAGGTYPLYGKAPKKLVILMKRIGTPTGSITCRIRKWNGGNLDSFVATIGSIADAGTLTTASAGASYTFENAAQTYVMVQDDVITIHNDTNDDDNYVAIRRTDSDEWDHGYKINFEHDDSGSTDTGRDMACAIYS